MRAACNGAPHQGRREDRDLKILYGIQTTGHGHLVRATPIVQGLRALGHEVHVLLSGPAVDPSWLARIGEPLVAHPGLTFVTEGGRIRHFKTVVRARPLRFLRDVMTLRSDDFDMVVTDYEPITAWNARKNGIRFLAAIPILIHLRRYGFHPAAIGLGAAVGCLIGGSAGMEEIISGKATRAGSTIAHHPIPYGTLMAMLAMCALYFSLRSKELILRGVLLTGTATGLIAVLLSGTRGLVPAVLIALAYLGLQSLEKLRINKARTTGLGLLIAATLVVAVYQFPMVQTRIDDTKAEISAIQSGQLGTSFGLRLQMWHSALYLASQSLLTGVGTGQEKRGAAAAEFLEEKGYNPDLFKWFEHLHSEYLDTLASYGLLGLAALLAFFVGAVRRVPLPGRAPLVMALAVITIEALTETVFVDTKLTMGFVFLVTALRAQAYAQTPATSDRHRGPAPLSRPQNGL